MNQHEEERSQAHELAVQLRNLKEPLAESPDLHGDDGALLPGAGAAAKPPPAVSGEVAQLSRDEASPPPGLVQRLEAAFPPSPPEAPLGLSDPVPETSGLQLKRDARSKPSPDLIKRAAKRGVSSGGAPLPHLDRVQASFGRHDLSEVRAHTGGHADAANEAMGARAYAMGSDIVFKGGAPDLHTVAHEAAHVIQQRGGVHLPDGVGREDDTYEAHADAVADKVVAGESAEALLDKVVGEVKADGDEVQRKVELKFKYDAVKDALTIKGAAMLPEIGLRLPAKIPYVGERPPGVNAWLTGGLEFGVVVPEHLISPAVLDNAKQHGLPEDALLELESENVTEPEQKEEEERGALAKFGAGSHVLFKVEAGLSGGFNAGKYTDFLSGLNGQLYGKASLESRLEGEDLKAKRDGEASLLELSPELTSTLSVGVTVGNFDTNIPLASVSWGTLLLDVDISKSPLDPDYLQDISFEPDIAVDGILIEALAKLLPVSGFLEFLDGLGIALDQLAEFISTARTVTSATVESLSEIITAGIWAQHAYDWFFYRNLATGASPSLVLAMHDDYRKNWPELVKAHRTIWRDAFHVLRSPRFYGGRHSSDAYRMLNELNNTTLADMVRSDHDTILQAFEGTLPQDVLSYNLKEYITEMKAYLVFKKKNPFVAGAKAEMSAWEALKEYQMSEEEAER